MLHFIESVVAAPGLWLAVFAMLSVIGATCFASGRDSDAEARSLLNGRLAKPLPDHPRLMLTAGRLERLKLLLEEDQLMEGVWQAIRREADRTLTEDPIVRELEGRRLLYVTQEGLKRIGYLGLAFHLAGDRRYVDRAEREMLALAAFEDWNPSHFLDVAEATAGLALGYDWLHDVLSEEPRQRVRQAIVEKGLQTSFDDTGWWVDTANNWAQVCHGGLVLGALAVYEDHPDLARRTLERALANIHCPMNVYGPNGSYPEGPGYWLYGTLYNVILIDAMKTALGETFKLNRHRSFMASADYYLHMHGPTLRQFNYSDNAETPKMGLPMFWFAAELGRPELLTFERRKLQEFVADQDALGFRTLPLLLLWASRLRPDDPAGAGYSPNQDHTRQGLTDRLPRPERLAYIDHGAAPVVSMRSGWDADAVFAAIRGGSPDTNHAHMDVGAFVFDADGVRWAASLGVQAYHSLESRGLDIWNRSQESDRWRVFRMSNHSKNTLVVDGRLQKVTGFAPIERAGLRADHPFAIVDLTPVYEGQAAVARRGIKMLGDRGILVQDELKATGRPAEVRWGMVTRTKIEQLGPGHLRLSEAGKTLTMRLAAPKGASFTLIQTAQPPADFDAPNPGTQMIAVVVKLAAEEEARIVVVLERGSEPGLLSAVGPLDTW